MVDGIGLGIQLIENIIFKTSFAGQFWITQLIIIVATMAIITRKTGDWKQLALPVMVGWKYFGMDMNWMLYAVAGIIFVVDGMSIQMVESAWGAIQENFNYVRDRGGVKGAYKEGRLKRDVKRLDIKSEMNKLDISRDIKRMSYDEQKDYEIRKELRELERRKKIREKEFPTLDKNSTRDEIIRKLKEEGKLD